jgi:hypothetical protein
MRCAQPPQAPPRWAHLFPRPHAGAALPKDRAQHIQAARRQPQRRPRVQLLQALRARRLHPRAGLPLQQLRAPRQRARHACLSGRSLEAAATQAAPAHSGARACYCRRTATARASPADRRLTACGASAAVVPVTGMQPSPRGGLAIHGTLHQTLHAAMARSWLIASWAPSPTSWRATAAGPCPSQVMPGALTPAHSPPVSPPAWSGPPCWPLRRAPRTRNRRPPPGAGRFSAAAPPQEALRRLRRSAAPRRTAALPLGAHSPIAPQRRGGPRPRAAHR